MERKVDPTEMLHRLRDVGGLSVKQLADLTGLSESTVKNYLRGSPHKPRGLTAERIRLFYRSLGGES